MHLQAKKPYRTAPDVAERYNDGVVQIYAVSDSATAGYLPEETLTEKAKLDYQERKLGIKRYYEAKQNQIHAERVIRVQRPPEGITNQDAAQTEDGVYYRIDLVQSVPDIWPASLDLTLVRYDQGVQAAPEEPVTPVDPVNPDNPDDPEEPDDPEIPDDPETQSDQNTPGDRDNEEVSVDAD